jgi:hypothetical protein
MRHFLWKILRILLSTETMNVATSIYVKLWNSDSWAEELEDASRIDLTSLNVRSRPLTPVLSYNTMCINICDRAMVSEFIIN